MVAELVRCLFRSEFLRRSVNRSWTSMHHRIVGQVLEVPKIPSRERTLECTVEQILVLAVLEKAERRRSYPKIEFSSELRSRPLTFLFRKMRRNGQSSSRLPPRTGFNSVSEDRSLKPLLFHSLRRSLRYPSFGRKKRRNRVVNTNVQRRKSTRRPSASRVHRCSS